MICGRNRYTDGTAILRVPHLRRLISAASVMWRRQSRITRSSLAYSNFAQNKDIGPRRSFLRDLGKFKHPLVSFGIDILQYHRQAALIVHEIKDVTDFCSQKV